MYNETSTVEHYSYLIDYFWPQMNLYWYWGL